MPVNRAPWQAQPGELSRAGPSVLLLSGRSPPRTNVGDRDSLSSLLLLSLQNEDEKQNAWGYGAGFGTEAT